MIWVWLPIPHSQHAIHTPALDSTICHGYSFRIIESGSFHADKKIHAIAKSHLFPSLKEAE